jgi:hypothetical protein
MRGGGGCMNEAQVNDRIRHVEHLMKALDEYNKTHYPLDLTESDYEVLKEALDTLLRDLYSGR